MNQPDKAKDMKLMAGKVRESFPLDCIDARALFHLAAIPRYYFIFRVAWENPPQNIAPKLHD